MAHVNINIRTDSEVKAKAQELFERLGLDMTTAINIFLRQAINRNTLPFEILPIEEKSEGKYPKPGVLKGKIKMSDDFDAPLADFEEYM